MFHDLELPFLIGLPAISDDRVSVAHLDEHRELLGRKDVSHIVSGRSSWIQYLVGMNVDDVKADNTWPPSEVVHRYLSSKLKLAMFAHGAATKRPRPVANNGGGAPSGSPTLGISDAGLEAARFTFSEDITWRNRLSGHVTPTEKGEADRLSIGGLRDAAASVGRLSSVASIGRPSETGK